MWINFDQLLDLSNVTVVNVRRSELGILKSTARNSSGEGERSERRYVVRIYSSDQGIISQC